MFAVSKFAGKQRIIAEESVLYDGFLDGEFLSPDELENDISSLIQKITEKIKKPIKSIIVGVPSEFCVCVCKRISRKFINAKKITESDLISLYQSNANFGDSEEYEVISFSPMQCLLDNDYKTLSPVGKKTTSLILDASYILAKTTFQRVLCFRLF